MTTEPRASASVVLLRDDRGNGLEVLLLRRHTASSSWGGAYVFPGGKLDAADCAPGGAEGWHRSAASLHAALGEPDLPMAQAVGLYVAAARETREECGVLLDTQDLAPWSHWITPLQPSSGTSKRFDTRFFVAVLPSGQEPVHDNVEAVDSLWLTPREALQRWWDQRIELAPPQIMNLVSLVPHADVTSVLRAARAKRPVRVLPEAFVAADGRRFLCYPGDPQHSVSERAQVGPTRMGYFDGRFGPEGGLMTLLDV